MRMRGRGERGERTADGEERRGEKEKEKEEVTEMGGERGMEKMTGKIGGR